MIKSIIKILWSSVIWALLALFVYTVINSERPQYKLICEDFEVVSTMFDIRGSSWAYRKDGIVHYYTPKAGETCTLEDYK